MEKDLTNVQGFIYKIVSPNGKIYIGQTINPYKRKYHYKKGDFKQQIKLWNNCEKHKWNPADTFEIIEQCICGKNKCFLNEREIFWIKFFNSFRDGLNCNEGGNGNVGYKFSEETLKKMSLSKIGIKHSEERNRKKSEYTKGRKHTEEAKKKMSQSKIANMNETTKNKIRVGLIGNKNGLGNKGSAKKIICINNNVVYDSIKKACDDLGLSSSNIISVCKDKTKHTKGYTFKYYD